MQAPHILFDDEFFLNPGVSFFDDDDDGGKNVPSSVEHVQDTTSQGYAAISAEHVPFSPTITTFDQVALLSQPDTAAITTTSLNGADTNAIRAEQATTFIMEDTCDDVTITGTVVENPATDCHTHHQPPVAQNSLMPDVYTTKITAAISPHATVSTTTSSTLLAPSSPHDKDTHVHTLSSPDMANNIQEEQTWNLDPAMMMMVDATSSGMEKSVASDPISPLAAACYNTEENHAIGGDAVHGVDDQQHINKHVTDRHANMNSTTTTTTGIMNHPFIAQAAAYAAMMKTLQHQYLHMMQTVFRQQMLTSSTDQVACRPHAPLPPFLEPCDWIPNIASIGDATTTLPLVPSHVTNTTPFLSSLLLDSPAIMLHPPSTNTMTPNSSSIGRPPLSPNRIPQPPNMEATMDHQHDTDDDTVFLNLSDEAFEAIMNADPMMNTCPPQSSSTNTDSASMYSHFARLSLLSNPSSVTPRIFMSKEQQQQHSSSRIDNITATTTTSPRHAARKRKRSTTRRDSRYTNDEEDVTIQCPVLDDEIQDNVTTTMEPKKKRQRGQSLHGSRTHAAYSSKTAATTIRSSLNNVSSSIKSNRSHRGGKETSSHKQSHAVRVTTFSEHSSQQPDVIGDGGGDGSTEETLPQCRDVVMSSPRKRAPPKAKEVVGVCLIRVLRTLETLRRIFLGQEIYIGSSRNICAKLVYIGLHRGSVKYIDSTLKHQAHGDYDDVTLLRAHEYDQRVHHLSVRKRHGSAIELRFRFPINDESSQLYENGSAVFIAMNRYKHQMPTHHDNYDGAEIVRKHGVRPLVDVSAKKKKKKSKSNLFDPDNARPSPPGQTKNSRGNTGDASAPLPSTGRGYKSLYFFGAHDKGIELNSIFTHEIMSGEKEFEFDENLLLSVHAAKQQCASQSDDATTETHHHPNASRRAATFLDTAAAVNAHATTKKTRTMASRTTVSDESIAEKRTVQEMQNYIVWPLRRPIGKDAVITAELMAREPSSLQDDDDAVHSPFLHITTPSMSLSSQRASSLSSLAAATSSETGKRRQLDELYEQINRSRIIKPVDDNSTRLGTISSPIIILSHRGRGDDNTHNHDNILEEEDGGSCPTTSPSLLPSSPQSLLPSQPSLLNNRSTLSTSPPAMSLSNDSHHVSLDASSITSESQACQNNNTQTTVGEESSMMTLMLDEDASQILAPHNSQQQFTESRDDNGTCSLHDANIHPWTCDPTETSVISSDDRVTHPSKGETPPAAIVTTTTVESSTVGNNSIYKMGALRNASRSMMQRMIQKGKARRKMRKTCKSHQQPRTIFCTTTIPSVLDPIIVDDDDHSEPCEQVGFAALGYGDVVSDIVSTEMHRQQEVRDVIQNMSLHIPTKGHDTIMLHQHDLAIMYHDDTIMHHHPKAMIVDHHHDDGTSLLDKTISNPPSYHNVANNAHLKY